MAANLKTRPALRHFWPWEKSGPNTSPAPRQVRTSLLLWKKRLRRRGWEGAKIPRGQTFGSDLFQGWSCLGARIVLGPDFVLGPDISKNFGAGNVQKLQGWKCLAAGSVHKFRAGNVLQPDFVPSRKCLTAGLGSPPELSWSWPLFSKLNHWGHAKSVSEKQKHISLPRVVNTTLRKSSLFCSERNYQALDSNKKVFNKN